MEPSGRSTKLGNRFEGTWIALQLLSVISEDLRSVEIETVGDDEHGVDLWVIRPDGKREAQQCKRGTSPAGKWSIRALGTRGVLSYLREQLSRDREHRFTLVSGDPAPDFAALCEKASGAGSDAERFYVSQILPFKTHRTAFVALCRELNLNPEADQDRRVAFDLLSRARFCLFPAGPDGDAIVLSLVRAYIDGNPPAILPVLRDLISDMRSWARPLDIDWLRSELGRCGLRLRDLTRDPRIGPRVAALRHEYAASLEPDLIGARIIARSQHGDLCKFVLESPHNQVLAVLGDAGSGKSCALLSLCRQLADRRIPYLPLRLDIRRPSVSARSFGIDVCDLPESPAHCLRALSAAGPAVLVLDQLDAIRWTSAHGADAWEACKDTIREALQFSNLRVVVACRAFDWRTDPQIRAWKGTHRVHEIEIPPLTDAEFQECIRAMGRDPASLKPAQAQVLRLPLALFLWAQLLEKGKDAPPFESAADLIRAFWLNRFDKLRSEGRDVGAATRVIDNLVDYLDKAERLDALVSRFDHDIAAVQALESVGLLRSAGERLRFAHQSYFDYRVARRVIDSIQGHGGSVAAWLRSGDQALFRRDQLRLALAVLRQEHPAEYIASVRAILADPGIRFHLKHMVLQLVGQVTAPTNPEVDLVLELLPQREWQEHVVGQVLSAGTAWFGVLSERGVLRRWLDSTDEPEIRRALWLAWLAMKDRGDEVGRLLSELEQRGGDWTARISNFIAYADTHASRELFDVQVRAISRGEVPRFAVAWRPLAAHRPGWCVEALEAVLRNVAGSITSTDDGEALFSEASSRAELKGLSGVDFRAVVDAARESPLDVWERLIPALLDLVAAAAASRSDCGLGLDRIWADGLHVPQTPEDALRAIAEAAALLARVDEPMFRARMEKLTDSKFLTPHRLGAMILKHCPQSLAGFVYDWLAHDPRRLRFGSMHYENSWKLSRQLLQDFGDACPEVSFSAAEAAFLQYIPPDEWDEAKRKIAARKEGWGTFGNYVGLARYMAMTAMPPARLSAAARNRLDQSSRKFGPVATCVIAGNGVSSGWMGHRIADDVARRLSNRAWTELIRRESERAGAAPRRGPDQVTVHDVALALEAAAKRQPVRFGELFLTLPSSTHGRILGAILEACRQTSPPDEAKDLGADWAPAPAGLIERILARQPTIDDIESALRFCRLIEERPDAHWSPDALGKLTWCATEHPHPDSTVHGVRVSDDTLDGIRSLEASAINCVRGTAAAAIEALLRVDRTLLKFFDPTLQRLVSDPAPAVRCAAVGALTPVLGVDRDRAMALFLEAVSDTSPAVLGVHDVDRFLADAVYNGVTGAASVVRRMGLMTAHPDVAFKGAGRCVAALIERQATEWLGWPPLGAFLRGQGWRWCGERYRQAAGWVRSRLRDRRHQGLRAYSARALFSSAQASEDQAMLWFGARCLKSKTPIHRKAAAEVAAQWADEPKHFPYCATMLRTLLDDPDLDVRRAAMQVLRRGAVCDRDAPMAIGLLLAAVGSRAFRDDPSPMLWGLRHRKLPLLPVARVVLKVCGVFAGELAAQSRDLQTGVSGDANIVSELLLRLYGEARATEDREIQRACMDSWDRMLRERVGGVEKLLELTTSLTK